MERPIEPDVIRKAEGKYPLTPSNFQPNMAGMKICPACGGLEGYGPTAHSKDCRLRNLRS